MTRTDRNPQRRSRAPGPAAPLLALAAAALAAPHPAHAYDWNWHDPAALPHGFSAILDVPPAVREALLLQAVGPNPAEGEPDVPPPVTASVRLSQPEAAGPGPKPQAAPGRPAS